MFWYVLGGAGVAFLVIVAYLLGRQGGNNPPRPPAKKKPAPQPVRSQPQPQPQPVVQRPAPRPAPAPVQRQVASSSHRKIEYAAGAALHFINALHAEGVDRGAIYSLGTNFRIDQNFTTSKAHLEHALVNIGRSKPNENTALYDSIALAIDQFQKNARQNVPWVLIVLTDGKDNASQAFPHTDKRSPAAVGVLVHECFAKARSNFFVLVGVGDQRSLDVEAIVTIGHFAQSPAIPLENFHLLEELFLKLVIQVNETIVGRTVQVGSQEFLELARVRQVNKIGIDYALVIDRSGSMNDAC